MAVKGQRKSPKAGLKAKKVVTKKAPVTKPTKVVSSKKNVSFSTVLEESRLIDDVDSSMGGPSETKPRTKSILKSKARAVVSTETTGAEKINPLKGTKKKIIVKKSVKEHLLTLNRKERKEFIRNLRAKSRPNFEISFEAKKMWEKLRSSKTAKSEKETLTKELHGLVKGKTKDIIYAHDTSRVIQCLLATGDEEVRNELFDELTPEIVKMCKSPYARFFVVKMLKYGTREQKVQVFNAFQGHCVQLLRNKWSANILETVYNDIATSDQRLAIIKEFYGNEFVIFRDENKNCNLDLIAKESEAKIAGIVKNLGDVLNDVIEKGQLKLSITHKLLFDYISHCTKQQKEEMIQVVKEFLPEICHTREGSLVSMECVWNSDAKTRKAIVKSFKDLSVKAANDKFGKRVLYTIFDAVDDTVIVNKTIVKEIADNIADVIYNPDGVHVLHYLVHPRDQRVIGAGMKKLLEKGDSNPYSKKDKAHKYSELFDAIKEPLYAFMGANIRELLFNKTSAVLVLDALEPSSVKDIFKRSLDDAAAKACFDGIKEVAADEFVPHDIENKEEKHIVVGGAPRFVLTKLLRADVNQPSVKLSDSLSTLPAEQLRSFTAVNSGCFDLYHMCLASSKAEALIKKAVNANQLKGKGTFLGARLLFEKITGKKWESS